MSRHYIDEMFGIMTLGETPRVDAARSRHRTYWLFDNTKYNSGNGLPFFSIQPTKGNLDSRPQLTSQSRSDRTKVHSFGSQNASGSQAHICRNLASPDHNLCRMQAVSLHMGEVLPGNMHQGEKQLAQSRDFPIPLRPQHSRGARFIQKTRTR